jgi:hypothetical protein
MSVPPKLSAATYATFILSKAYRDQHSKAGPANGADLSTLTVLGISLAIHPLTLCNPTYIAGLLYGILLCIIYSLHSHPICLTFWNVYYIC